jgi:hypothetical protein
LTKESYPSSLVEFIETDENFKKELKLFDEKDNLKKS